MFSCQNNEYLLKEWDVHFINLINSNSMSNFVTVTLRRDLISLPFIL